MNYSVYNSANILDIKQLYTDTFSDAEGKSEGNTIGELAYDMLTQTDKNELYCFIAQENKQIVAAIIFTKITFENNINAYILSPVAVKTKDQSKGIGQQLINYGIKTLKNEGIELLFTYGDPNYYSKVGYKQISEDKIKAPQPLSFPNGWLCQSLTSSEIPVIKGESYCVSALNKAQYW